MKEKGTKEYYQSQFRAYKKLWSRDNIDRKNTKNSARVKCSDFYKWRCNDCGELYAESEIQVDHVVPVNKSPSLLNELLNSIELNESNNLQVLCLKCHKMKNKIDNHNKIKNKYIESIEHLLKDSLLIIGGNFNEYDYLRLRKINNCLLKYNEEKDDSKKKKILKKYSSVLGL